MITFLKRFWIVALVVGFQSLATMSYGQTQAGGNAADSAFDGYDEVLAIRIMISGDMPRIECDSTRGVLSIPFGGYCDNDYFKGRILPGAADTQRYANGKGSLSARYWLEGKDKDGQDCRIFVENNAEFGAPYTRPVVFTDSRALAFLNDADLRGVLDFSNNDFYVRIYARPKPQPKPEAYEYGVFYYQRASLFDALKVAPGDIVMLGNSLTNGCEWHELLGMPNVKNRGISSDVIQGVYDRMPSLVAGGPSKIFLLIGVNDVSHNLGVDSIATAYGELIDMMRREMPDTRLYVQSMLPINISFGRYLGMADKEDQIRQLNARISAMAEDKGFTWIDLYTPMSDAEGHLRREFTNDGLHLLGPGYLVWRDVILPYINE